MRDWLNPSPGPLSLPTLLVMDLLTIQLVPTDMSGVHSPSMRISTPVE